MEFGVGGGGGLNILFFGPKFPPSLYSLHCGFHQKFSGQNILRFWGEFCIASLAK